MRVKIASSDDSDAIRLPKSVMDKMHLVSGSEVELNLSGREIRISAAGTSNRLTLEGLIKSMDEAGPEGQSETIDWGPDRGSEIIEDDYSLKPTPKTRLNEKKRAI